MSSTLKPIPSNASLTDSGRPRQPLLTLGAMMLAGVAFNAQAETTPAKSEKTLPTVTVSGNKEVQPDGYRASKTRVGKVQQDPHEIPQAVTTVTNTLMEEQQVGSLREALRNVSGLTFNAAEGGRSGDNMMLRGFYTFGDMYLDGIRDTAQYNRETFNLEQIDVLRGSAAMLFGRGQAGGVINQVSKTPLRLDRNKVTASLGNHDYREVTGDFNKRINDTTAIRLNVMNRDEGSKRANPTSGTEPELHRSGIAASVGFGLSTADEIIASHVYTKTRDIADYGVSFDSTIHRVNTKFPAEYFWGIDRNFDDSDTHISSVVYSHTFQSGAELRTQLRHADYKRQYWAKTPNATLAPSPIGATGGNQTRKSRYETVTLQSDLTAQLTALGMKHELLAGIEYLNEDGYRRGLLNVGTASAPQYYPDVENTATPAATFKGDSYALYAQDSIEFVPQWKLLIGARRDQLKADYSSTTSPKLSFGEWSVRTGLSWQPAEESHYYLSLSDSFSPTADLYQLSGGAYDPERSQVIELGAKWLFMHGDLALRTALYRANKEWERNTDLESTASILTRKRRTDGIEFELAGRITPQWEVFSGLALMNAKILEVAENRNATTGVITKADARLQGQRARNTPDYTFNLWTTYKLTDNWKVGGGVEAKGKRYVYSPSTADASSLFTNGEFNPNTAPAYERWDAMVSYEAKSWTARLNVRNLADKVYYDALYDNGGFAVPGTRRAYILTGEFKF